MDNKLDKMAGINSVDDNNLLPSEQDADEFEQMLNDFIAREFDDDIAEVKQNLEEIEEKEKQQNNNENIDDLPDSDDTETTLKLNEHEFSLLRAYRNFMYSIENLCEENNLSPIAINISEEKLYPHFKRKTGTHLCNDILNGWDVLLQLFPNEMQTIRPDSSDDQILDVAERCENENLQLAIISYVETMIELEGCEIDYQARKIKYERKQLEKQIYEEHQKRVACVKRYIQAIKDKNFPVDAEKLVNNYFRLSNKDPEGSFKALTTNPATFAPIDFSKIRDRFFGLIKVKPQDGIRINQKLGDFLRKLKI